MFNEINSIFIIHQIIFFYHKLIIIFYSKTKNFFHLKFFNVFSKNKRKMNIQKIKLKLKIN